MIQPVEGQFGVAKDRKRQGGTSFQELNEQAKKMGEAGGMAGMNKAVLEINPNHAIVKDLDRMVKEDKESDELQDFAMLMYDVASMTSGYEVKDMKDFAKRVMQMMDDKATTASDGIQDAEVVKEVVPEVVQDDE